MRIYASNNGVYDFCFYCAPTERQAEYVYGIDGLEDLGPGPDSRGDCFQYDAEHPNYASDDFYRCSNCGDRLSEND